jgi:hypothetical protein
LRKRILDDMRRLLLLLLLLLVRLVRDDSHEVQMRVVDL